MPDGVARLLVRRPGRPRRARLTRPTAPFVIRVTNVRSGIACCHQTADRNARRGCSVRVMRCRWKIVAAVAAVSRSRQVAGAARRAASRRRRRRRERARKPADVPGTGTGVTADTIKLGVIADRLPVHPEVVRRLRLRQPAAGLQTRTSTTSTSTAASTAARSCRSTSRLPAAARRARCRRARRSPTTARCSRSSASMYDPTGDAQLCVAKQHKTALITDGLTQAIIDKAPPGLLISPGITSDRRLKVIMSLLKERAHARRQDGRDPHRSRQHVAGRRRW